MSSGEHILRSLIRIVAILLAGVILFVVGSMIGYGVIRCFVEGLRTDSLYLMPGVRVSQVLSGCLILLGVLLVGTISRRQDIQA